MSDRCTGHCCRSFSIPYSIRELTRAAEFGRRQTQEYRPERFWYDDRWQKQTYMPEDAAYVADMLIQLPEKDRFTCRHLLQNGNCGNYAHRPGMCSRYPYGVPCTFNGCTWSTATTMTAKKSLPVVKESDVP
jgi:Fe-S-cluster containining protein